MILHDEVNEKAVEETGSGLLQGTDHTAGLKKYKMMQIGVRCGNTEGYAYS
jgi:hypothetical protein